MDSAKSVLRRNFGWKIIFGAVTVVLAGCATKEWVQEYVAAQNNPIQANVSQVDGRVTQVDGRVTQVAAQTGEARKVADEGVRRADKVNGRLTKVIADQQRRTLVEAASLQFASGKFALQPDQMKVLDEVHAKLLANPTYTIDIVGQTDAAGAKKNNYALSWQREEQVRRYLAAKGDVLHRIAFIGFGPDLADAPKNQAEHRQVTVAIYRPNVE